MKKFVNFELTSAPTLSQGLRSGLRAYALDSPQIGSPTSFWILLADGSTIRVGVQMHNLRDWEEIGTLTFVEIEAIKAPKMTALPPYWRHVKIIEKLLYINDSFEVECGFSIFTVTGEKLTVLPGADVYTLAIQAPFFSKSFNPENNLSDYKRKLFF